RLRIELVDAEDHPEHLLERGKGDIAVLPADGGEVHAHLVAAEPQTPHRLDEQARLARPRVSDDGHDLATPLVGHREQLADAPELVPPPDELAVGLRDAA